MQRCDATTLSGRCPFAASSDVVRRSSSVVRSRMTLASIRAFLRSTAPCRLVGKGRLKGFQRQSNGKLIGTKLRGLTKRLTLVYGTKSLPSITRSSNGPRPGRTWSGRGGGRKRGAAVDAQLSAIINGSRAKSKRNLRLTNTTLAALKEKGLRPVVAQRSVLYDRHGCIATAADFMAMRGDSELVVVELKCGFVNGRTATALTNGRKQRMRAPLTRATDCVLHRHMAQLATTHRMFVSERGTMRRLRDEFGVDQVSGVLVYVDDDAVEFVELTDWWKKKGGAILSTVV